MKITWLGHSCFRLASAAGTLVLDPYSDGSVPGLAPLRTEADAVCCSHDHRDHNAESVVRLSGRPCGLRVERLPCFHDDRGGALRGANLIHIVSDGAVRVVHCGDLGHMPDEETLCAMGRPDALLLPVGGYYTIAAETANALARRLGARVVLPMHYRKGCMGYDVIAGLDRFLALRERVVQSDDDHFELTPDTPAQTLVLRYKAP